MGSCSCSTGVGNYRTASQEVSEGPRQAEAVSTLEYMRKALEKAERPYCPVTAMKLVGSGEYLYEGVVLNPCCGLRKPRQELQEMFVICDYEQKFQDQILGSVFLMYQILMQYLCHMLCMCANRIDWQCIRYLFSPKYIINAKQIFMG